MLESNMSWNLHINHISLKNSKAIGILYRLKTIYPQLVLQTLYNTLILPYFNYCILAWGATISEGNPLHLLQKKALSTNIFHWMEIRAAWSVCTL